MRAGPKLEQPVDVVRRVDVESDELVLDHDGIKTRLPRSLDDDARSSGDAERRLDGIGRAQRERVGASVLSRAEGDRLRGFAEDVEDRRTDERAVRHHHERAVCRAGHERLCDGRSMAVSLVDQDRGPLGGHGRIRADDENLVDRSRGLACFDDVGEHREHEIASLIPREQRVEPALCGKGRIHRDDREHDAMSIRV